MPPPITAQRVRIARERAGLTQVQLADLVGLSHRPVTISDIETGRQGLAKHAPAIARACETTTDFLYGLTDDPVPPLDLGDLPEERRDVIRRLASWLRHQ